MRLQILLHVTGKVLPSFTVFWPLSSWLNVVKVEIIRPRSEPSGPPRQSRACVDFPQHSHRVIFYNKHPSSRDTRQNDLRVPTTFLPVLTASPFRFSLYLHPYLAPSDNTYQTQSCYCDHMAGVASMYSIYSKTSPLVEGTTSNQKFLFFPLHFTHLHFFISVSAIAWWNRCTRHLDRPLILF